MLFVTRQPKKVFDFLLYEEKDYYFKKDNFDKFFKTKKSRAAPIKKKLGFDPIFASSMNTDEDLIFSALTSNPSCIQCYIVFETDEFETISFRKWIDYLGNENQKGDIELEVGEEPEYIVECIRFDQVRKLIPVQREFDKNSDVNYLLSEEFYRQTPLLEKNGINLGETIKLRSKDFNVVLDRFSNSMKTVGNKEKFYSDFREDIRKFLG